MRILSTLHSFNVNGVLIQNYILSRELAKRGHETVTIAPDDSNGLDWYSNTKLTATQSGSAEEYIEKTGFKPDVLIDESLFSVPSTSIAAKIGAAHLTRVHEEYQDGTHIKWNKKIQNNLKDRLSSSNIVFPCKHTRDSYLERFRIRPDRCSVIYGTVDEESSGRGHPDDSAFTICQVGTIYKRKGALKTIEAFGIISAGLPNSRLYLVGARRGSQEEIDYEEECAQKIKRMSLDDRAIIVPTTRDVHSYISMSDVMTLHSESESFPTSLLEGMRIGIPFVASEVGGIREMTLGNTGFVFGTGDVGRQADLLLDIKSDLGMWRANKHNISKTYQDQYSTRKQIECFLKTIEKAKNAR